jgi:hypothetical protein
MAGTQSYANHKKYVPGYHAIAFVLLLINVGWSIRQAGRELNGDRIVSLLTAIALVLVFFYARAFAIQVQDRVIRLEERLRLARLLPDDLRGRLEEFTVPQLVALRFASDAELPGLARRVLQEGMADRDSIKRAIKDWRADHQRA